MAIDPSVSGVSAYQQVSGTTTQIGDSAKKVLFLDELSPAEQKDLLEQISAAQNPSLAPPTLFLISTSDSMAVGVIGDQSKHDTIINMLDTWIESLHKIDDENKQAQLKRMIEGVSIAFHSYQHSVSPTQDPNFPTFSVGVILGAIGVHEALLSSPLTHVAMNPIVDIASQFPLITGDMRAELGLIGTLVIFGYGMQYGAVANQIKSEAGQKFDEKAYAKNFAEQVLSTITDDQFNSFLLAIVSQSAAGGEPMSDEKKQQSVAYLKATLLSLALGSLYLSHEGGLSGQEFYDMIRPKKDENDTSAIVFDKGDFKNNFVDGIRHYMTYLEPNQRVQFTESMMAFLDSKPSIATLSNPARAFAGIHQTLQQEELQA